MTDENIKYTIAALNACIVAGKDSGSRLQTQKLQQALDAFTKVTNTKDLKDKAQGVFGEICETCD